MVENQLWHAPLSFDLSNLARNSASCGQLLNSNAKSKLSRNCRTYDADVPLKSLSSDTAFKTAVRSELGRLRKVLLLLLFNGFNDCAVVVTVVGGTLVVGGRPEGGVGVVEDEFDDPPPPPLPLSET